MHIQEERQSAFQYYIDNINVTTTSDFITQYKYSIDYVLQLRCQDQDFAKQLVDGPGKHH